MGIRSVNNIKIVRQKSSGTLSPVSAKDAPAISKKLIPAISNHHKEKQKFEPRESIFKSPAALKNIVDIGFDTPTNPTQLPPLKQKRKYPGLAKELSCLFDDGSTGIAENCRIPEYIQRLVNMNSVEMSVNTNDDGIITINFYKQDSEKVLRMLGFELNPATEMGEFTRVTRNGFAMFVMSLQEWGFTVGKGIY